MDEGDLARVKTRRVSWKFISFSVLPSLTFCASLIAFSCIHSHTTFPMAVKSTKKRTAGFIEVRDNSTFRVSRLNFFCRDQIRSKKLHLASLTTRVKQKPRQKERSKRQTGQLYRFLLGIIAKTQNS